MLESGSVQLETYVDVWDWLHSTGQYALLINGRARLFVPIGLKFNLALLDCKKLQTISSWVGFCVCKVDPNNTGNLLVISCSYENWTKVQYCWCACMCGENVASFPITNDDTAETIRN